MPRLLLAVLVAVAAIALGALLLLRSREPPNVPAATYGGDAVWLQTPRGRLKALVFRSTDAGADPRLIVVLHGDAPFERPGYQYRFAASATRALHSTIVAAILRPGYTDPMGDKSDGARGMTTGDNYTPGVIDTVANAVQQLRVRFDASAVTLVGHSGGAAIAADIMERHPDLAESAMLVSCPCDVRAWRRHMAGVERNPLWHAPVASLSPIDHVNTLSPMARLLVIAGAEDNVAPPAFSEAFAHAALRHAPTAFQVLPHLSHNILLEPPMLTALQNFERPRERP